MTGNPLALYVFPGQGSQYRGIGSDLHRHYEVARRLYDRASAVLGYDIAELSFHDPQGEIHLTRHTQPVLLTHSIACLEVFKSLAPTAPRPAIVAGHSLGEYSALVAAGALSFEAALRLVQKRGECMGTHGAGEMSAFPLELDTIRPFADKHFCGIAGCNLPDQTVVGGLGTDLDRLEQELAEHFPRKRAVRLKTEGAFHTYYMIAAARHYRPALETTAFAATALRALSNYSGDYHDTDPAAIKARLFYQLFHPVLWYRNLMRALADGATTIVEFGGGIGGGETPTDKRPNLEGMIKKAQRGTDFNAEYHAAINNETILKTAEYFNKV